MKEAQKLPAKETHTNLASKKGIPMKRFVSASLLLLCTTLVSAQTYTTADEVAAAMDALPEPGSSNSEMTMVITSGSGQSLSRSMQSWTKDDNSIVKFTGPADIEGSGFLTLGDGTDEESYLWLPALGRVRRLATSGDDQDGAFFGSDFTYEDLDFDIDDWNFELLEVGEGNVYVMEGIPVGGSTSQYSKIVVEVPEDTLILNKAELYKGNEVAKIQTISEIAEVGDYRVPAALKMETLATGSFTTIEQANFVVDEDVPDDVFTERFLQR